MFFLLIGLCYNSEGCWCNERGFVQGLARRQYYIVSKGVASELDTQLNNFPMMSKSFYLSNSCLSQLYTGNNNSA